MTEEMPTLLFKGVARKDHPDFGAGETCEPHELEIYDGDGWFIWKCPTCGMSTTNFLTPFDLELARTGRGAEIFKEDLASD